MNYALQAPHQHLGSSGGRSSSGLYFYHLMSTKDTLQSSQINGLSAVVSQS